MKLQTSLRSLALAVALTAGGSVMTGMGPEFKARHHFRVQTALSDEVKQLHASLAKLEADEAWEELEKASRKLLSLLGPGDSPERADGHYYLGSALNSLGRDQDALHEAQRALEMFRRIHPNDHPDVARSLNNVALCLVALVESGRALQVFEESLAMYRRLLKGDHSDVADGLNNLAFCLEALGEPGRALSLYEDALAMWKRLFKGDHPHVALGLNNVAHCLEGLGDSGRALPLYEESLEMRTRLFEGDQPLVASSLNNVAHCLDSLGESGRALPLYEESLAMWKRLFEGDHPDVARSLNNLAACLESLGEPGQALPLYEESLPMWKRLFEGDHPDVATSLNSVAYCLDALGESGRALPLFEDSLAMQKRLFKGDHEDVATGLNNVAACLETLGELGRALPLYEESLAMRKRLFKGDHPDVALGLINLAACLDALGESGRALPLNEESLAMRKRLFEGDHPDVADSLNNVAYCLNALDESGRALPLYEESLAMRKRLFKGDHPNVADSLNNLASCLDELGKPDRATSARREWLESVQAQLRSRVGLADTGVSSVTESESAESLAALPLAELNALYADAASLRYLQTRTGVASQVQQLVDRDSALQALRSSNLRASKAAMDLAMVPERDPKDMESARRAADVASLNYLNKLKEKYGDKLRLDPPSLSALQKMLGPQGAAVDVYKRTDRKEPYYLAVVIRDTGAPEFRELGSEKEIKDQIDLLLSKMTKDERGAQVEPVLQKLDELTLGRLDDLLKGRNRVYVATDGILAQVPLAGLVTGSVKENGRPRWTYRLEQMRISLVPSVLEVAAGRVSASGQGSVLVAAVDYEADVAGGKESAYPPFVPKVAGDTGTRGYENGKWDVIKTGPAEIAALRNTKVFQGARIRQGKDATETWLSKLAAPKYLHFSTHGFFTPKKQEPARTDFLSGIARVDDSMIRSGLVLAGANKAVLGKTPSELDGWLTAAEVSRLRLRGTRLVTLAACSTGRGDISVGLGVMGLRRAFRAAGASGVVMSLWDVPDKETSLLMQAFYGELSKGASVPDALHIAQLSLVRQGVTNPYSWAAFTYEGPEK